MKTKYMPNTSLTPSVICLGTERFGSDIPDESAYQLMDRFRELGGNFIDTAKVYGDWVKGTSSLSEKVIGRWMKARGNRNEIVLATKGAHPDLGAMHVPRLEEQDVRHDIEQSLQHLQTDYIDLYWLHRDDPGKPAEEVIEYMNQFVREGKIRYFACSNWRSSRIEVAHKYAAQQGLQGFAASQTKWSIASYPASSDPTLISMDELEYAYHILTELPAVPYNSQASGFFSGKYSRENLRVQTPENAKVWNLCTERNLQKLDRVEQLARELNASMTSISLAALTAQPFPVYPIVGCRNISQLEISCQAANITLDMENALHLLW